MPSALDPAVQHRYAHGEDRPLRGYLGSMSVYGGVVAATAGAQALSRRELPRGIPAYDVLLMTAATQRVARTLSKDAVTSPLRAPFTRFEGPGGPSEVHEEVVATGWRHAVGELLSCPFCLAQWVATAFMGAYLVSPRATRVVAATMAVVGGADALQLVYARLQSLAEA